MSQLLTEREAAAYLNMSASFLKCARCRGGGPIFRKLSRAVRYLVTDLDARVQASERQNTIYTKQNMKVAQKS